MGSHENYVASALAAELKAVRSSTSNRNETLVRAAFSIGTLVGAGAIDRATAETDLLAAALECGLSEREARSTIRSGLNAGQDQPRDLPIGTGKYRPPATRRSARSEPDLESLADRCFNAMSDSARCSLANSLGVTPCSLTRLHVGADGNTSTWPERSSDGLVIGVMRRQPDGSKKCFTGSRRGLILPDGVVREGPDDAPLLVAEGASDVAALLSLGLPVIGRPALKAGSELLSDILKGHEGRLIILADEDGDEGAEQIAAALVRAGIPGAITWARTPGGEKDPRSWLARRIGGGLNLSHDQACIDAGADFLQALSPRVPSAPPTPAPRTTWRPFPKILPSPLQKFVEIEARAMQVDPAMIALPVLATCAGAIGLAREIELKPGWREPSILWAAIVARSGSVKTESLNAAIRPLRRLQEEAFLCHKQERQEHERNLAAWEERNKKQKNPDDPKPELAPCKRMIISDATIEAVAPILKDNHRGVLLVRDELRAWLGSFGRFKGAHASGGEASMWLEASRAGPVTVDRKGGDVIHVPRAGVNILGTIQPGILRRAVGGLEGEHVEDGLLARFLLAQPPERRREWDSTGVSPEAELRYSQVIRDLADLEPDRNGDPIPLRLSPAAEAVWGAFYNRIDVDRQDAESDAEAALIAKIEGYGARLALIVHLVRVVCGEASEDSIDDSSMQIGVELAEWFLDEARRLYGLFGESDEDAEERQLADWISKRDAPVSIRDLTHGLRKFRGKSELAEQALDRLVDTGWGRWEWSQPGPKGGPQTRRFVLVTTDTVTTTPLERPSTPGCGDGDAGDTSNEP